MSGHSKWSTIKRQKGVADAKRGLVFTKLSNAITIAVRQGGGIGDPNQNFRLRLAMEAARKVNMPKDTIDRAIQKALGKAEGSAFEEVVYEGFGPGGVAVIVEAATDNKNRTAPEIKSVFEKNGGTIGQPGAVSYLFKQVGQIVVDKGDKSVDDVFLDAADAGAENVAEEGDDIAIYTAPVDLASVRDSLQTRGYNIKEIEIIRKPINLNVISDNLVAEKIIAFLEKLEDLDDVQNVYTNFSPDMV